MPRLNGWKYISKVFLSFFTVDVLHHCAMLLITFVCVFYRGTKKRKNKILFIFPNCNVVIYHIINCLIIKTIVKIIMWFSRPPPYFTQLFVMAFVRFFWKALDWRRTFSDKSKYWTNKRLRWLSLKEKTRFYFDESLYWMKMLNQCPIQFCSRVWVIRR